MDGAASTTLRSRAQPMFYRIAVATQTVVGDAYFAAVTRTIRQSWHVAAAFVARIDPVDPTTAWIAAMDSDVEGLGRDAAVRGTPWLDAAQGNTVYRLEVPETFANDPVLGALGARTYISVPLTSQDGDVAGYVGLIDSRRWHPNQVTDAEALLRLIAPRVSAELERLRTAREARMFRSVADMSARGHRAVDNGRRRCVCERRLRATHRLCKRRASGRHPGTDRHYRGRFCGHDGGGVATDAEGRLASRRNV